MWTAGGIRAHLSDAVWLRRRRAPWGDQVIGRVLRFEGIRNLRDLGGRATLDGRRVAHGRLYRSGSLHEMTGDDKSALEELGIRTVIDLRSHWERRQQPYEWPGVRVISAPLVDDQLVASINARFEAGSIPDEELEDWWRLTRVFQAPEEHSRSIRVIFDSFAGIAPGEAVLFHCRGGKDRTGLVAALLLEALDVAPAEILADFMLSNRVVGDEHHAGPIAAVVDAASHRSLSKEAIQAVTGVKQEWLESLSDYIEVQFGSVRNYLVDHIGIGVRGIERLREIYLESTVS